MPIRTLDDIFDRSMPIPFCGCWIWMGATTGKSGYPQTKYFGRNEVVHRLSVIFSGVEIPDGYDVDHKCKVRLCVNPDHLEPVTRQENNRRADCWNAAGRKKSSRTHCQNGHEWTEKTTRPIAYKGRWHRQCKACEKERYALRSV